jgi:hypothetical protein
VWPFVGDDAGEAAGPDLQGGRLKLRGTTVTRNRVGVSVFGASGDEIVDDDNVLCAGPCANLGTAQDPGNNNFAGNSRTALEFIEDGPGFSEDIQSVQATGNVWNARTQGANRNGVYPQPVIRAGTESGKNFFLPSGKTKVTLGPAPVGTFELSPKTLTTKAGGAATWRLTWRHPVSWKRLDEVVLRLQAKGKPVGRIVLDQETRRLRGSGAAIRLMGGRSAVPSRRTGGRKVSARLVLRVAKRYAGRTLVAKLAARDDQGNRQPFRRAGRVRVLAH